VEELATAADIQRRADTEEDTAAWVELNHEFHSVFVKAARSPRLASILTNLADSAAMYVATSLAAGGRRRTEANAQHRALLDAVRQRDADTACAVMLTHIQETVDTVVRVAPDGTGD
jgi:DNA-binding GntR family transcriptional regulator